MSTQYILIDGQFHFSTEKEIPVSLFDNLLFREKIRSVRNVIPFWKDHLQVIALKLKLFNQPVPTFLQNEGKELKRQIERTLVKNKLFQSAIIHLHLFLNENRHSYIIKTTPILSTSYTLNTSGLCIAIYEKITKGISPLSSLDLGSEPLWKLVRTDNQQNEFDELLLTNSENSILEAPAKNIYVIKGKHVFTPSPEIGTYIDYSQHTICQVSDKLNLKIQLMDHLNEEVLLQADEIFLASSTNGIEWVKSFKNKRYFNKTIKLIHAEFNHLLLV